MKLSTGHHLVYCFNCFSCASLVDLEMQFKRFSSAVRKHLKLDEKTPLGVGLHFHNELISTINVLQLQALLDTYSLYVPTLNAFPYHPFHEPVVKEKVYLPHWGEPERMEYTLKNLMMLSTLLPEGIQGVVSTLPFGYKDAPIELMGTGLKQVETIIDFIQLQTGKKITLAFEPEPDCWVESVRGLPKMAPCFSCCFDTSHAEIVRDKLKCEIPISKIQLSAALQIEPHIYQKEIPSTYMDKKYLHQSRIGNQRYADLQPHFEGEDPLISHFHMPVYLETLQEGVSVCKSRLLTTLDAIKSGAIPQDTILEIETYTWSILYQQLGLDSIEDGIAKEYEFILNHIQH